MPRIKIYTTPWCPYCIAAKQLLANKGASFEEIDVSGNAEMRKDMMARSNGRHTVPQIFIEGRHIGGSDDLHRLDRAGKLDPLLAE